MDVLKAESNLKIVKPQLNIKICLKILRATGSWHLNNSGLVRYIFFAYSFCIYSVTVGFFVVSEVVNLIFNYNNLGLIASSGPLILTHLIHSYKCITVFRNRQRLRNLLTIVDSPIFAENNLRYENIVSWYAHQAIFHYAVFQIISSSGLVFWTCMSILSMLNGEKRLPLEGWYPYDTSNTFNFILTLSHQMIGILLCSANNIANDNFIAGLLNVASCQFEILKWNISSLGNYNETRYVSSNSKEKIIREDNNVDEKLRRCIEHNLMIFEFIREVQSIFSNVVSIQLIFNTLVICLITFSVSQMPASDVMGIFGEGLYLVTMSYQIFIYCWQGNEVSLQNESLATAIYLGNWWKLSLRNQRDLQIIMLRTRKPFIVTTSFLIKLTVETCISILQMSYSMYTLLRRKNM